MRREHCDYDEQREFATGNYGICTTPELEWWFVREPTEKRLRECTPPRDRWPEETELVPPPGKKRQVEPWEVGLKKIPITKVINALEDGYVAGPP